MNEDPSYHRLLLPAFLIGVAALIAVAGIAALLWWAA